MPDPLARLGHRGIAFVGQLGAFLKLCWETVRAFFVVFPTGRRVVARVGLMQIFFTGVQSVPVLSLIAVLWGIVVIVESATTLPALGATNLMGRIFVVVVVREMGPLLTAFVIISRSGTAITAELASMVVHDEIAALKVMDINVPRVIIAPRLVGAIVAAVSLTVYFVAVAVSSGYIAAYWFTGLPLDNFVQNLFDAISAKDLVVSLAKSVGFGMIVSLLSCYHGLSVNFSPTEIPQVVTRATVASLVWCFVYGSFLTVVSF